MTHKGYCLNAQGWLSAQLTSVRNCCKFRPGLYKKQTPGGLAITGGLHPRFAWSASVDKSNSVRFLSLLSNPPKPCCSAGLRRSARLPCDTNTNRWPKARLCPPLTTWSRKGRRYRCAGPAALIGRSQADAVLSAATEGGGGHYSRKAMLSGGRPR